MLNACVEQVVTKMAKSMLLVFSENTYNYPNIIQITAVNTPILAPQVCTFAAVKFYKQELIIYSSNKLTALQL